MTLCGVSGKADGHTDSPVSTGTHPIQNSTDEKQVDMKATKTGQNESQAAAVATTESNETHTQTNETTGINETHAETGSNETPMHADGPKTGKNESHTETNGPKTGNNGTGTVSNSTQSSNVNPTTGNNETHTETSGSTTGNNETGTVPNSTQSSNANQTAGAAAREPTPEPPSVLSIFLVNDLQYDIFPVHPENGNMCDMDTGKCPSMGSHVQMAMRVEVRSLGM